MYEVFEIQERNTIQAIFLKELQMDPLKLPFAFALEGQSLFGPRKPLHASVTFWEAYTLNGLRI